MKIYLNEITGLADAFTSMYMTKRNWTREKEVEIRKTVERVTGRNGYLMPPNHPALGNISKDLESYNDWMDKLLKFGVKHITLLRYIYFSITVEGLHRAGQDDWDAHAWRYNNCFIRTSTRAVNDVFKAGEKSDFYKDKILSSDEAFMYLGLTIPESFEKDGVTYVKTVNGYIREDMKDNQDVKRGLYMLSIPSNFIFKVNLTEWAHVYKQRNINGVANPEVKEVAEEIADQMAIMQPKFTRELFLKIEN